MVALLFAVAYASLARGVKASSMLLVAAVLAVAGLLGLPTVPETDRRERVARWLPAIIPLSISLVIDLQPRIVEVLLPDPDRRWAIGFATLVIGLLSGFLVLLGIDVRHATRRAVHAITSALRFVVSMLLYVFVLLPLGVAHLWRRADPLRTGTARDGSAWHPAVTTGAELATRSYRRERPLDDRQRRPIATATCIIGAVALLLVADFALGTVWNHVAPDGRPSRMTTASGRIGFTAATPDAEPVQLDAPDAETFPPDPREELPAMAKYPWRHEYFQELQRAPTTFWPYLMWRPLPATGRYLNITESGERLGYATPGATGPDVPDVDFYGGSTMYGEGQRDQHTIASEVTRLAEGDGLPIRAHNRGVRGWVNWQELLLFEQVAADPATRPDIAVFYDGANEITAQGYSIRGVPAHTVLDEIATTMSASDTATTREPLAEPTTSTWDHLKALASDYRDTSATARAGGWLRAAVTGEPAAADASTATSEATERQQPAQGAPGREALSDADLAAVPEIYRRGQALIESIAKRARVDVIFFWQPVQGGGPEGYADGVQEPTIDLSRLFIGHDDIFIDGTHHNEDGSVIAAEALWEHLKPQVQAWYDGH